LQLLARVLSASLVETKLLKGAVDSLVDGSRHAQRDDVQVHLLLSVTNRDERLHERAMLRSSSFLLGCVVCVPAVFQLDNVELAGRKLFSFGPVLAAPDCY